MVTVEKKLHLIKSLIKENNELVLIEVEKILNKSAFVGKRRFADLNISMTVQEAIELGQLIDGQIHKNL